MFVFLICTLTLHQVHSACVVQDLCTENEAVQKEILDLHNAYRRAVQPAASNMLIMSYSKDIAALTQAWIDNCNLTHGPPNTRMIDGYELGENLFYSTSPLSWTQVMDAWHSEVEKYTYPVDADETTGHYVQIVWNSSYRVGCGYAFCPRSSGDVHFYGCQYYRAGNFQKWPPYKEGLPCDDCPNDCVDGLCNNPCPHIDKFLNCQNLTAWVGCGNENVDTWCPASCNCHSEIIPIH